MMMAWPSATAAAKEPAVEFSDSDHVRPGAGGARRQRSTESTPIPDGDRGPRPRGWPGGPVSPPLEAWPDGDAHLHRQPRMRGRDDQQLELVSGGGCGADRDRGVRTDSGGGAVGCSSQPGVIRHPSLLLLALIVPAVLFTIRLKYAEWFVLKTFCPWCLESTVTIVACLALALLDLRRVQASSPPSAFLPHTSR